MKDADDEDSSAGEERGGGLPSVPVLIVLAAVLGLLLGAAFVALVVLRRPAPPPAAPVTAPLDDGRTEEQRLLARAEAGDARAMLELGRGLFQGAWGRRDEKAAERWLGLASNSCDAAAASEATQLLEELRRFVRARRFERSADEADEHGSGR